MTNSEGKRESAVMMSSAVPSARNPCLGSFDILATGSTAIEGLSGKGSEEAAGILRRPESAQIYMVWLLPVERRRTRIRQSRQTARRFL